MLTSYGSTLESMLNESGKPPIFTSLIGKFVRLMVEPSQKLLLICLSENYKRLFGVIPLKLLTIAMLPPSTHCSQ